MLEAERGKSRSKEARRIRMSYDNRQAIGRCHGCQDQILSDEVYGFIGRKPVHDQPDCIKEASGFTTAEEYAENSKPLKKEEFGEAFNRVFEEEFPDLARRVI
jgi:hypothetical protein